MASADASIPRTPAEEGSADPLPPGIPALAASPSPRADCRDPRSACRRGIPRAPLPNAFSSVFPYAIRMHSRTGSPIYAGTPPWPQSWMYTADPVSTTDPCTGGSSSRTAPGERPVSPRENPTGHRQSCGLTAAVKAPIPTTYPCGRDSLSHPRRNRSVYGNSPLRTGAGPPPDFPAA